MPTSYTWTWQDYGWKSHQEERGTMTKCLPVQQKDVVLDTHPVPGEPDGCKTDQRQVRSAEWPRVWPGCVQSNLGTLLCGKLGKKLVSILQRSSYLVWLVTQMARTRAGFRMVSCSVVSLVVSEHERQWNSHRHGAGSTGTGQSLGQPRKAACLPVLSTRKDFRRGS